MPMLEGANQLCASDVAIVGMALRVPGARNVTEFWKNLCDGVESIRTFSVEELLAAGEEPERIHHPNYVPRGADLPDMEMFDAEFFGLNPREAAIMDPQHRQFLECAWEAMEDAGRSAPPDSETGPVGVFAGCGMGSYFYFNVCSNRNLVDQVGMFLLRHTGNDKDFLSTRASFTFDLRGPSVNVQSACSTSLVAVHYACQSLISGECDMALAGGVTIEFPHRRGYLFQEGEILSPDGHCRAFDHRSAGTVFGSGVGVVALRRLSDALRDGDVIHAVIKGTAVNNDGSSKAGYLAPSVSGQAAAILEAQGLAGVEAASIQYVECHGTGTPIGDPIEIEALTSAFRQGTARTGFCHVGSVKSNIGHLDTAAGVVGLIKAALAVREGRIPPTLGFEKPNPAINFEASPFKVNNKLMRWPEVAGPRRAAVNSLGVGGTNAHVVIEQAPSRYMPERDGLEAQTHDDPMLLFLSGKQRNVLDMAAGRLAEAIDQRPTLALEDIGFTLLRGRKHLEHRLVMAVRGREDAIAALSDSSRRGLVQQPVENVSGAVFLFPGGGSQYIGMARCLYEEDQEFRSTVEEGLSYLPDDGARDVRRAWFAERTAASKEAFLSPSLQLPAILIAEIAVARMWKSWGVVPKALIGHSMGENAAACFAGVMSFKDGVNLVHLRGRLFERVPLSGMLSIQLDPRALSNLLPSCLDIASVNAPSLCVVSGLDEDLRAFQNHLADEGVEASRIPINIAAHSRLLDPILGEFEEFLRGICLRAPAIPILSNRTGLPLGDEEATDPLYWVGHLRSPVQFSDGMAALAADRGNIYIEVGPGRMLSSLAKAQGSIPANQVINSLPHPDEAGDDRLHFLTGVGRAWAAGLDVDVDRLWKGRSPRRVDLPTYPFQHKRFFIDPAAGDKTATSAPLLVKQPNISRWGYQPAWKQSLADLEPGAQKEPRTWLFFVDSAGLGMKLVDRLRSLGHQVVTVSVGDAFVRCGAHEYTLCPELGRIGYDGLLAGLAADECVPSRIVHMWLLTQQETFRAGSNFFHRNQECGFDSLVYLAQALGEAGTRSETHVSVITNGMQQVKDEPLPNPEKAMVLGPALVMPRELPGVSVGVIDIDLPPSPRSGGLSAIASLDLFRKSRSGIEFGALVEQVWEELQVKPKSEVVALRKGRRWTQIHQRLALGEVEAVNNKLKQGGVYLFSGGLSEIALALAGEIARRFQARIALVGRTQLPAREEWDFYRRTHGNDRVRRAITAIRRLEADGANVLYLQADVTNPEQMRLAIDATITRFGEINGVFHAAGIVDDGLILSKTREAMDRVLAPKVLGTAVLDAVLETVTLDFLVLFSSTSTDVVRAGQADYVAANAYLNSYAQSHSNRADRTTMAVHWGVWGQTGLAARALGYVADHDDAHLLPEPAKGPFFQRWVEDEHGLSWLEAVVNPNRDWILNEHRLVSGQAVMPGTGYIELIAQAAAEYGLQFKADISDLVFLKPLAVKDGEDRVLRLRLQAEEGGYRVTIAAAAPGGSADAFIKHVEAHWRPMPTRRDPINDIKRERPDPSFKHSIAAGGTLKSAQERHVRFGPRWAVLRSVVIGADVARAELLLDQAFSEDLDTGVILHPALLDIATGFAMELVPGYDPEAALWAPATYGRIILHNHLPAEVVSYVRLADSSELGDGYAAFDVVIADREGDLLFEAQRFVVRRLDDNMILEAPADYNAGPRPPRNAVVASPTMAKLGVQVRNGILPSEGFEVLMRAMAAAVSQPIISSMDLDLLKEWVSANAEALAYPSDGFERPDLDNEFVAPRNAVEEILAGYWRELLGVTKIGVHDSFFDIGGHSLIAVRLFRMIKKQYGLDLPISTLFEAPTIAQCAERLMAELPDAAGVGEPRTGVATPPTARRLHLVLMNSGGNTQATPLFICAGMFGNVLNLRHLALTVGADRPVYGLQARGLYGDLEPHLSFEEMAADCIKELKTVQPHGPYVLAGYSGGGITAYEIARQLEASGDQVAHIVMLDTPLPRQPKLSYEDKLLIKLQDIRRHKARYLLKYLRDRSRHEAGNKAREEAAKSGGATDRLNNDKIEFAFRHAAQRYQVRPYGGPVTLFKPQGEPFYRLPRGRSLKENRDILLPDNGWNEHVVKLKVLEVPGDHDSMVLDPYARGLAEKIRALVAEALAPSHGRDEHEALQLACNDRLYPSRSTLEAV
ncbi:type I polyketide synthase [Neorhizobium sp. SOG26]|uniref:type I polyketide synthase n=1 Tax=Neorhizobium sp. SOG26 TaxID=2060726 RepID=UPI001FDEDA60|nr:type I polyketide synthase [Neorhizobium sp. SOG26]